MLVRTALGNDVDHPRHRILPIDCRSPRNDLDSLDGFIGNQVEVDGIEVRLIHSHAVDEHGRGRNRLAVESPEIYRLLKGIPDTVVHHDAGRPLNGFLNRLGAGLPDVVGRYDGHFGGKRSGVDRGVRETGAGDDHFSRLDHLL